MANTTALDLIRGSIRLLGKTAEAEALSAEDADNALATMNEMLEAWQLDRDMAYVIRQDTFTWPLGQISRTIGTGGNVSVPRPVKLEPGTFARDSEGLDWGLTVIDEREQYNSIIQKSQTQTTRPWALFYERSFPLGILNLYPVPSVNISVTLSSRKELQEFSRLNELMSLPPGYRRAIRYNLAVALAPEFSDGNIPQGVAEIAMQSLAAVKRLNLPRGRMTTDIAFLYGRGGRGRHDVRQRGPY